MQVGVCRLDIESVHAKARDHDDQINELRGSLLIQSDKQDGTDSAITLIRKQLQGLDTWVLAGQAARLIVGCLRACKGWNGWGQDGAGESFMAAKEARRLVPARESGFV